MLIDFDVTSYVADGIYLNKQTLAPHVSTTRLTSTSIFKTGSVGNSYDISLADRQGCFRVQKSVGTAFETYYQFPVLNQIYALSNSCNRVESLMPIYRFVSALLGDAKYDEWDDFASVLDIEKLNSSQIVGFLRISARAKQHLREWNFILSSASARLEDQGLNAKSVLIGI